MKKNDSWLDKLIMNRSLYVIITVLFIGMFSFIFKWQHEIHIFDKNYIIDNELLGTFGDFVGGVLGTVFALLSTLILIRTFNQQKKATDKNTIQLENQRFNDLFFELLKLYQSQVAELCGHVKKKENDEVETIDYNNKDFFDIEKVLIQNKFIPHDSYEANMTEALNEYMVFYIKNKTKVAACFRTLFRIYDLIDNAALDENVKKNYLKIIRAQLTDSELFFIRYNCLSYYGENFIEYINKYNVLKHLSLFDLLEFKNWWENLNEEDRMGINILFFKISRVMRYMIREQEFGCVWVSNVMNSKYKLMVQIINDYEAELYFYIDNSKENIVKEFAGFGKISNESIQSLLISYFKEVFIYFSFKRYNKAAELHFESPSIAASTNDVTIINVKVSNVNKKKLILSGSV